MIQAQHKNKRNQIVDFIEKANDYELNEVMNAVEERYKVCYPDWDVIYLALPKGNPDERERMLREALSFLSGENV